MFTGQTESYIIFESGFEKIDTIYNSISSKKSCFVDEKDINENIILDKLSKNHYSNKYQNEFDNEIDY